MEVGLLTCSQLHCIRVSAWGQFIGSPSITVVGYSLVSLTIHIILSSYMNVFDSFLYFFVFL